MRSTLVHVGVRATDLAETLRCWKEGLRLRTDQENDVHRDLTDGWHNVRVFQHAGPARSAHVLGMLDYLPTGLLVSDLAQIASRLRNLEFTILE